MTPVLRTVLVWLLYLLCGFFTGVLILVADTGHEHSTWGYVRSGLIALAPTLAALKTTLEKNLGIFGQ